MSRNRLPYSICLYLPPDWNRLHPGIATSKRQYFAIYTAIHMYIITHNCKFVHTFCVKKRYFFEKNEFF